MPTSGVPGQQATPNAIRAMPVTRATGMATPVKFLTEQQPPNERRNNQQRHAGRGFTHGSENKHSLHRLYFQSFAL